MFLFESEFLHYIESSESVEYSHECPHENIRRIVHAIMYTRESHKKYNQDAIFQKSFLEIGNDHDEECRECHMTRREGWIMEPLSDLEEIWMDRIWSWAKYSELHEKCLEESLIEYEVDRDGDDECTEERSPEVMLS